MRSTFLMFVLASCLAVNPLYGQRVAEPTEPTVPTEPAIPDDGDTTGRQQKNDEWHARLALVQEALRGEDRAEALRQLKRLLTALTRDSKVRQSTGRLQAIADLMNLVEDNEEGPIDPRILQTLNTFQQSSMWAEQEMKALEAERVANGVYGNLFGGADDNDDDGFGGGGGDGYAGDYSGGSAFDEGEANGYGAAGAGGFGGGGGMNSNGSYGGGGADYSYGSGGGGYGTAGAPSARSGLFGYGGGNVVSKIDNFLSPEEVDLQKKIDVRRRRLRGVNDAKQTSKTVEEIRNLVTEQFDIRTNRREVQLKQLENRLEKLRHQLKQRSEAKEDVIDVRVKSYLNEARGIGF